MSERVMTLAEEADAKLNALRLASALGDPEVVRIGCDDLISTLTGQRVSTTLEEATCLMGLLLKGRDGAAGAYMAEVALRRPMNSEELSRRQAEIDPSYRAQGSA